MPPGLLTVISYTSYPCCLLRLFSSWSRSWWQVLLPGPVFPSVLRGADGWVLTGHQVSLSGKAKTGLKNQPLHRLASVISSVLGQKLRSLV